MDTTDTCVENLAARTPVILRIEFSPFPQPIIFPELESLFPESLDQPSPEEELLLRNLIEKGHFSLLSSCNQRSCNLLVLHADPLYRLSTSEKSLLWKYRMFLHSTNPSW